MSKKVQLKGKKLPELDPKIFWDVEYSQGTIQNYPEFTIERVIQRGSQKDFEQILSYFGKLKIKKFLKNNSHFNPKNRAFLKTYFQITDKYLCSQRPSFPKLWKY